MGTGHASLEETTTYLNVTRAGLQESMRKYDDPASRCNPVASTGKIERARRFATGDAEAATQPLIN